MVGGQMQPRRTLGHPMVWVILAMALLWAWGVSREDAHYAPPQQQASLPVSSADLLFIDGPRGRIDVALVEAAIRVVRIQPFGEQRLQLKERFFKVRYGKEWALT